MDLGVVMTLEHEVVYHAKQMQVTNKNTDDSHIHGVSHLGNTLKNRRMIGKVINQVAHQYNTSASQNEALASEVSPDVSTLEAAKKAPSKVVTKNGTTVQNYIPVSNIRQVKHIASIGDSVALGSRATSNYSQMLAQKLGAKLTNHAVSGATMAKVKANSIYEQATRVSGADLIFVQGTDDDWLFSKFSGVDIGKDPKNVKTYYGAFYQTISVLKKNNPNAKIVVMTATRQLPVKDGKVRRRDTDKNKKGLTLEDYVNAQVSAAKALQVPVFDIYHSSMVNPYDVSYRNKNMPDGLHPNELAHEVIMYELVKHYYNTYG